MNKIVGGVVVVISGLICFEARATCVAVSQPLSDYVMATNKCMFPGPEGSIATTCVVGTMTVATLNPACLVAQVPSSWATWSSPPDSESATPRVCFHDRTTETITFTSGGCASVAGVEVENEAFEPSMPVTVSFRSPSGTEVMSITRDVLGRAGARLFAVQCDEPSIDSLVITTDPAAFGFGFAQVRSDLFPVSNGEDAPPSIQGMPLRPNATTNAPVSE